MKYLSLMKSLKGWLANMSQNAREILIVVTISIFMELLVYGIGVILEKKYDDDSLKWSVLPLGIWDLFVIICLSIALYH